MAKHQVKKTHVSHAVKPAVHVKKSRYTEAVGRRKTAVARVRLFKADEAEAGQITVNERPFEKYFSLGNHQKTVKSPFERLGLDILKTSVKVNGGGVSAQAEAVRHGIARALVKMDETLRKKLKQFGFLTRDPRMVERKKYGLKKARRAPQWSKR
jgi:small subunit ribosomal protein S9